MLTVVHDAQEANDKTTGRRSLLDEIVRDGARQMLAVALKAEIAAYVEQFADQLDENGRRLVVRNGYHQAREVLTAAGAVEVKAPRVNDRRVDPDTGERQRFSSAVLPAWARKSPQMSAAAALPKSAHLAALAAIKDIYNAEDIDKAQVAVKAFEIDFGAKYPKAVAKIVDDLDTLLEFYKYPAEHWIPLRTTNPNRHSPRCGCSMPWPTS
jgi:transposase-like protein